MKIQDLRKKIIINFSASGFLLLTLGGMIAYTFYQKGAVENKVSNLKTETLQLKGKVTELQLNTIEIKKYKDLYKGISANKKNVSGLKMSEVNAKMNLAAEQYNIISPSIKVNLPEVLKDGVFRRVTVNILFTTATLTFNAADDVRAISFISDFLKSLPGYPIVSNLELKKSKEYSMKDLIDLSTGKSSGSISAKVDFFWYVHKDQKSPDSTDKNFQQAPNSATTKKILNALPTQ